MHGKMWTILFINAPVVRDIDEGPRKQVTHTLDRHRGYDCIVCMEYQSCCPISADPV